MNKFSKSAVLMTLSSALIVTAFTGSALGRKTCRPMPLPMPPVLQSTPSSNSAKLGMKIKPEKLLPSTAKMTKYHSSYFTIRKTPNSNKYWRLYLPYTYIDSTETSLYSHAHMLDINGSGFAYQSGIWKDKAGFNFQTTRWNTSYWRTYRLIKFYPAKRMVRWIDIIHNPSQQAVTINPKVRSYMNYNVSDSFFDRAQNRNGKNRATAFCVKSNQSNQPYSISIGASKRKAKLMSFYVSNNKREFHLCYPGIRLKPGQTIAIMTFLKNCDSKEESQKFMKSFRAHKYLDGIPAKLKKCIINFDFYGPCFNFNIARTALEDELVLKTGDPLKGEIQNKSFEIETNLGKVNIKSSEIIGMAAVPNKPDTYYIVLCDGQVFCGKIIKQKIELKIPSVGLQNIPLNDISEWVFKVSKDKPEEYASNSPFMTLENGNKIVFYPSSMKLHLKLGIDLVKLSQFHINKIVLTGKKSKEATVFFKNGSILKGQIAESSFKVKTKSFKTINVSINDIRQFSYCNPVNEQEGMTEFNLKNGDIIYGKFYDRKISVTTKYGNVKIDPINLHQLTALNETGKFKFKLWNGSILTGKIDSPVVNINILPGPKIALDILTLKSVQRCSSLPAAKISIKANKLIQMLGSESYQDRVDAQKQLTLMGAPILPLLQKHLTSQDAEIRQRVRAIILVIDPSILNKK